MAVRRFYRLVSRKDAPLTDFYSLIESGHPPYNDPGLQRRAEEVSVWDSMAAVLRLKQRKPHLAYVAILEIPESVELTRGRRGHWGIPRGIGAARIKDWVSDVVDLP